MTVYRRIPMKQLAQLCRRVGTELQVGVDVRKIWDQEAVRAPLALSPGFRQIRDAIGAGESSSEAMHRADGLFPALVVDLVSVGDGTGHTAEILLKLADHYDHMLGLRRTFLLAIIWPAIQLLLSIVIVGLLLLVMSVINQSTHQDIDVLGLGLTGPGGVLVYVGFWLFVFALGVACYYAIARGVLDVSVLVGAAMRIPGVRSFVEVTSLARFSWSLGLTLNTGMPVQRAMQLALAAANNRYYQRFASQIDGALAAGQDVGQALRDTGAFPVEYLAMIEVGEESGRLPESLEHVSHQLESQAQARSTAMTIAASMAVWGIVGCLIIVAIFRIFMFYANTLNEAVNF